MGQIRLHSKENPDGTFTYHAKCRLETVTGIQGETFDNPIRTIVWNAIQNKYVVKANNIESDDDDDAANDKDLFYDNNDDDDDFYDFANNRTGNQTPQTILGRECWCARLFHQNQPDFEIDNFLEIGDEASFCPIDSNADGLLSKRDVRVCDAQAVIDRYGQILSKDQQCHSELPMAEFAKSTWPLCFFWWILLVYMLCGTHYGSRVMGYIKRNLLLKCIAVKKRLCGRGGSNSGTTTGRRRGRTEVGTAQATAAPPPTTTAGEQPPSRNSDAGDTGNSNDNADEEQQQGGGSDSSEPRRRPDPPEQRRSIPPPPPPLPPPRSETDVEDRSDWTERNAATIERDFGSYDNYLILDRELRHQANASNNEYVTWLWYSAVYTEVRRFRYERWVRRRERERERYRRLGRTPSEEAEDDDGDDIEASTGWLQGSRQLDRVFWWPPSGPDGSRWEYLQRNNPNNNQPPTNEDGRPIDPSRLNLKTKRFFLDDSSSRNGTENHTTTTPTEDEPATVSEYKVPEVPDNMCSICLCELEDGDLVGDIPCGHLFHKDCLKEWLTKNNHCPICRLENIAHHPVGRPRCVRTPRTTTNDTTQDSNRIHERTSVPLLSGW